MLYLTRKAGQAVYIDGKRIKVSVKDIQGGQVRLCFEAPEDTEIWREELMKQVGYDMDDEPETEKESETG